MAQIDPNIALGFKLPQIQDPLAAYARAQDIGVNALKMQEYQRGLEQENKLRSLIASGADLNSPETLKQMYSISPKMGAEFEKSRATIQKEKVATAKDMAALEASYMKNARDMLGAVGDQNSYNVWREQTIKNLPGLANLIPPQYSPQTKVALMADANKYLDQTTITAAQQLSANVAMRGQDMARIPQGYRMTGEGTLEAIPGGPTTTNISPKEMQIREAKRPQATLALKTFEDKTSTLEKDINELINHPGLPSITGIAAGRLPGITAEGRAAEAIYNRIVKAGGFRELQEMRNASPTGGALGQVSNQENTSLQQTFAAIDRTQEAKDIKKQLAKALDELRASKGRVREAFDMTYDYRPSAPSGGAAAPAAGGATPTLEQLLEKYK
jgi:hypothetical protein